MKINRQEAEKFSQVWTRNGIIIPLNHASIDFATDFANIVLSNFIRVCEQKAIEAKRITTRNMVMSSIESS